MLEILSDLKISNCETRHCSVVSVGCPLYSDTQLTDSWQLWRGRAGDALDSVRQDRHYPRKVALVTSVMVVILPPIWKLLSLISFINLLFSLVISLKVRRERTQYPHYTLHGHVVSTLKYKHPMWWRQTATCISAHLSLVPLKDIYVSVKHYVNIEEL